MSAKSTALRAALTTSLSVPSAPGGRVDHEIVDDAAVLVEQLRVALPSGREVEKVGGTDLLERGRNRCVVGGFDQRLPHMRNIEQPGALTRAQMLGEDASWKLDRHIVAGERRHARAKLDMQGMERRLQI